MLKQEIYSWFKKKKPSSDKHHNLTTFKSSQDQEDDKLDYLLCNCCLETLDDPITLMCGHNFCSMCLANWFLSSKKNECMVCRTKWFGCPKVNLTLKKTIQALKTNDQNLEQTSKDVVKTKKIRDDEQNKISKDKVMKQFEKECSRINFNELELTNPQNTPPPNNYNINRDRRRQNTPNGTQFTRQLNTRFATALFGFFTGLVTCVVTIFLILTIVFFLKYNNIYKISFQNLNSLKFFILGSLCRSFGSRRP
jgi:hypothetical protein